MTSAADNLDEPRGIEYYGTPITLTSRVSHDNVREDPTPLSLDVTKKKKKNAVQLPGNCAVVPYIDEYAGDITLSPVDVRSVRSIFAQNPLLGTPEQASFKHLYTVVFGEGGELQEMPVTHSVFFSNDQRADVRPTATVGIFRLFIHAETCYRQFQEGN